jgi:predicted kinase
MKKLKPKILILKGLPASGKTTFAKKMMNENLGKYIRINKDEIREMLNNKRKGFRSREWLVVETRDNIIKSAIRKNINVIIDDTNLNPWHIKRIKELAKNIAEVEIVDLTNTSLSLCIKRDKKRDHSVGEKVIKSMYEKYIKEVKNNETNSSKNKKKQSKDK